MRLPPLAQRILFNWLSAALALFIVDALFDSLWFDGLLSLLIASLVLVVVNLTIKPLLMLLSLPFIAITMGLAIPLINGLMLLFVAELVDGFHLSGYWMAVLCALVFSLVSVLIALATGQTQLMMLRGSVQARGRRPGYPHAPHRPHQDEHPMPRDRASSTGSDRGGEPSRGSRSAGRSTDDDVIEVEAREKKDD